ncbi:DUF6955 family protein [Saccharolobus islandicus]|uniref:Uncharacterized protein n=6 Tax=Saccharolobus islandicus TaxID=43080 RepID=M9UC40_SACIS|nr:hypothetical protein [Sulfolobus islandicus]ACP39140.1 conserved hypothetical protein [Sulfolobus islandicus M.14.25]ACP56341.1 conserved hypothetical protein [Sulfolobus islandicus M.16.27]ACR43017.1 conserved hypothetical protein [Sulfolobus islandicus M.16.4]ADX83698.1 conserved hypothetical protein [Sulfolobus islandicus HVE10/4]ADX86358.1 conserved hypothetical protein [Sulfolobus islandicus REY15A]
MKIYIWLSEEMSRKLEELGLNYAREVLGGMKRIEIDVEQEIVEEIVKLFPNAKVDSSTTKSIELLPRSFKNEILRIIVEKRIEPKKALMEAIKRLKGDI